CDGYVLVLHQDLARIVHQRVPAQDNAGRVRAVIVVVAVVEVDEGTLGRGAELIALAAQAVNQVPFQRVADSIEIRADPYAGKAGDIDQGDIFLQSIFSHSSPSVDADSHIIARETDVGRRVPEFGDRAAHRVKDRPEDVPFFGIGPAVAIG